MVVPTSAPAGPAWKDKGVVLQVFTPRMEPPVDTSTTGGTALISLGHRGSMVQLLALGVWLLQSKTLLP